MEWLLTFALWRLYLVKSIAMDGVIFMPLKLSGAETSGITWNRDPEIVSGLSKKTTSLSKA